MTNLKNLPAPSPEQGLNRYMQDIRKFPMLEPEQEYMLAKRWVDHEDTEAAHQMVTSHLRLAAKIAMGYRGYGLPQAEVISEANVGLMQMDAFQDDGLTSSFEAQQRSSLHGGIPMPMKDSLNNVPLRRGGSVEQSLSELR